MRFFLSFVGIIFGIILVWKTYPLSKIFGTIPWAEQNLGGGGTYVLLKIIGILFIVFSFMYMFGILDILLYPFHNLFGGLAPKSPR